MKQDKEKNIKYLSTITTINSMPKDYYVYVAVAHDIIYYIGKGSKSRHTHCNSGKSGNTELNRLHFLGVVFEMYLAKDGLDEDTAFELESKLIDKFKPLFNNKMNNPNIGFSGSKVKGSINNRCLQCNNKFSLIDVLPGNVTGTQETGACVQCREWKSEDDWPHEVIQEFYKRREPNDQKPTISYTPGKQDYKLTYREAGKERVVYWNPETKVFEGELF